LEPGVRLALLRFVRPVTLASPHADLSVDIQPYCYYNHLVRIEFDPRISARNEAKRQLPFERAVDFGWPDSVIIPDDRNDYPESRFVALDIWIHGCTSCASLPSKGNSGYQFSQSQQEGGRKHGNRLPLIDEEGEVRELTKENLPCPPASEVLPEILGPEAAAEILKPRPRGPQKSPRKTSTTIRLDVEVLEAFRAMGKGWQTRMNNVLKGYVKSRKGRPNDPG